MSLQISESKISQGINDIIAAFGDSGTVPDRITDYDALHARLRNAVDNIPGIYRTEVAVPFAQYFENLGKDQFDRWLVEKSMETGSLLKLFDIAQAILQRGENFRPRATHAFQEVVCDLYDGFVAREQNCQIGVGSEELVPPMTKWGGPKTGPYTWDLADLAEFGIGCGIVNLPVAFADRGLFAWVSLGHEVTGHALVFYKDQARLELEEAVRASLGSEGFEPLLVDYWASRMEETASDVCGVLHMGPSVGVGLICAFRAQNQAQFGTPVLSGEGRANNPHPATILRGYLVAKTSSLLAASSATDWATWIAAETDKDVSTICLNDQLVEVAKARHSAEVVASTLASHPCEAFGGRALIDIRNWSDADEALVDIAKQELSPADTTRHGRPVVGSHAVTAAIDSVLGSEKDITRAFDHMQGLLQNLHLRNRKHTGRTG